MNANPKAVGIGYGQALTVSYLNFRPIEFGGQAHTDTRTLP